MQACLYFKATVLHCDHNVSKDLQELLDRQNYFTEIPKIILNNREVFRIKGIGVWVEDRGRGEGRRDRKHCKKETHREITISTHPLRVSTQTPSHALPERASEGGSTRLLPTGVKEAGPANCPSCVGLQPTSGPHMYTSI